MKTRIITALILIAAALGLIYFVPAYIFNYIVIILAFFTFAEYLSMFKERNHPLFIIAAILMLLMSNSIMRMDAIFLAATDPATANIAEMAKSGETFWKLYAPLKQFIAIIFASVALIPMIALTGKDPIETKFRRMNVYFFGFFYFGITFGLFPLIKSYTFGLEPVFEKFPNSNPHWFLFMLVIPWVCDSAAYFGGKALGKHKFAPAISPKKTWEGAVFGMIFSALAGLVFSFTLLKNESVIFVVLVAFIDGIFAQFGDLIESLIKRGAGVKDSGNLIPGHGGLFDRTDSLLVSAVVVFVSLLVKSYVG